jgi:hypothetical protein
VFDTPAAFNSPEDIGKRAAQALGSRQSAVVSLASPTSRIETEIAACYDRLRRAELRRNTWVFSTRKAALRPIQANMTLALGNSIFTPETNPTAPPTGSLLVIPSVWSSSVTYTPGAIVQDPNVPGMIWTSLDQENLNNAPGAGQGQMWDSYFGPVIASPFDPTAAYFAGELVYVRDPNTGAVNVYRSLTEVNGTETTATVVYTSPTAGPYPVTTIAASNPTGLGNPWVLTEWNPQVTYNRDQVVQYEFHLYRSTIEQNVGNLPGLAGAWTDMGLIETLGSSFYLMSAINWLPVPCTVQSLIMAYPVGAGPVQDSRTRNAFRLPAGYLRRAAQDPTVGSVSYLGAPGGDIYRDWQFEGKYLTTRESSVIALRFVADITKVADMDDMFCEGLAARIAAEICEVITQSTAKLGSCESLYRLKMGEARQVNAIESGSDQPPEDDFVACRL